MAKSEEGYTVRLFIDAVRGIDLSALEEACKPVKFRIVWQGFATKGQTSAVAPDADGNVVFGQSYKMVKPTVAEREQLHIALFIYTTGSGEAQNTGLATVDIRSLASNQDQTHKFKLQLGRVLNQKVELEFRVTSAHGDAAASLSSSTASAPGANAPKTPPANEAAHAAPPSGQLAPPLFVQATASDSALRANGQPELNGAAPSTPSQRSEPSPAHVVETEQKQRDLLIQHEAVSHGQQLGHATVASEEHEARQAIATALEAKPAQPPSANPSTPPQPAAPGSTPPLKHDPATPPAPAAQQPPSAVLQQISKQQQQQQAQAQGAVAAAGGDGERKPPHFAAAAEKNAERLIDARELRAWVADVLAEIKESMDLFNPATFVVDGDKVRSMLNYPVPRAASAFIHREDFSIHDIPIDTDFTTAQILGIGPFELNADDKELCPAQRVEERLIAAALEVFLKCKDQDVAGVLARAIRQDAGVKLLRLLALPDDMKQRVFPDTVTCTSFILHQVQVFAFAEKFAKDSAEVRRLVVYVNEHTYGEWVEAEAVKQLSWEVPLMLLKPIDGASDGALDLMKLEQEINADQAAGSVPVAVVGRMGHDGLHGSDDMAALMGICKHFKLWLHVEGPAVSYCALEGYPPGTTLKQAIRQKEVNVSVALCEEEVDGLQKLPGFWAFSSGPHGGASIPSDRFPELDIHSASTFLPGYLRVRSCGSKVATDFVQSHLSVGKHVVETLQSINDSRHWPEGSKCNIVAKLRTHPSNLWATRFTLMPHDHPLMVHDLRVVQEQLGPEHLPIDRINLLNTMLYDMLKDTEFFSLSEDQGLVQWRWCRTEQNATEVLDRFKHLVTNVGQSMINVAQQADKVAAAFNGISNLTVVKRMAERDPLELCCLQLVPPCCDSKAPATPEDVQKQALINKDLDDINRTLLGHCNAANTPDSGVVFKSGRNDAGHVVALVCLGTGGSITSQQVEKMRKMVSDVTAKMLKDDSVILRIEGEVLRRGIQVAENQLKKAQSANNDAWLGGMFRWWGPATDANEDRDGLQFDLSTSTLTKEIAKKSS
ncbi:hypothetical protein DIPPA_20456 [Diplonema papillatum]|nr:hypothetical protein DIPPA_20456 [Diplonema papillatum]